MIHEGLIVLQGAEGSLFFCSQKTRTHCVGPFKNFIFVCVVLYCQTGLCLLLTLPSCFSFFYGHLPVYHSRWTLESFCQTTSQFYGVLLKIVVELCSFLGRTNMDTGLIFCCCRNRRPQLRGFKQRTVGETRKQKRASPGWNQGARGLCSVWRHKESVCSAFLSF